MKHLIVAVVISTTFLPTSLYADADGFAYLNSLQGPSGQIESNPTSAWSAMAYGSFRVDSDTIVSGGASLRAYLTSTHPSSNAPVTEWERQTLGFLAMGVDPEQVAGVDYLATIESHADGTQLGSPQLLNDDIFGILALVGAGRSPSHPVVTASVTFLLDNQMDDGGWGFAPKGTPGIVSDVDDTAAALEAFGLTSSLSGVLGARVGGRNFLTDSQNADGGFPNIPGQPSNCLSTAWAVRAINSLGEDPATWNTFSTSPLEYLASCRTGNGGFTYSPGTGTPNGNVTSQVVLALSGKSLPVVFTPETGSTADETGDDTGASTPKHRVISDAPSDNGQSTPDTEELPTNSPVKVLGGPTFQPYPTAADSSPSPKTVASLHEASLGEEAEDVQTNSDASEPSVLGAATEMDSEDSPEAVSYESKEDSSAVRTAAPLAFSVLVGIAVGLSLWKARRP